MANPAKGAQGKKVVELQKLLNDAVKSVRLSESCHDAKG